MAARAERVQEYRNAGMQECRNTGIQEYYRILQVRIDSAAALATCAFGLTRAVVVIWIVLRNRRDL